MDARKVRFSASHSLIHRRSRQPGIRPTNASEVRVSHRGRKNDSPLSSCPICIQCRAGAVCPRRLRNFADVSSRVDVDLHVTIKAIIIGGNAQSREERSITVTMLVFQFSMLYLGKQLWIHRHKNIRNMIYERNATEVREIGCTVSLRDILNESYLQLPVNFVRSHSSVVPDGSRIGSFRW